MAINPLTGIISGASSQLQKTSTRIQNVIATLLSGSQDTRAADNIAGLSIAAQLQNRVSSLKAAGNNLAQGLSLVQVASGAIGQQQEIVQRLQSLAAQSNSGALTDEARTGLNTEFQGLVAELNRLSGNTRFSGQNLLDGTFSFSVDQALSGEAQDGAVLNIPNTSSAALFDGKSLNISTAQGATDAAKILADAARILGSAQAQVAGFAGVLGYASASLESAIFNQEAARSELSDADFAAVSTQLSLANLLRGAQTSTIAQGNRLPSTVLDLLNG